MPNINIVFFKEQTFTTMESTDVLEIVIKEEFLDKEHEYCKNILHKFLNVCLVPKMETCIPLQFLTKEVRLLGILTIAKTQIPVKANFMGK